MDTGYRVLDVEIRHLTCPTKYNTLFKERYP
jgi:hypothetical protein